MDSAPLRDFLQEFVAVQLAAAGPALAPESVRGFGVRLEAGALELVVLDEQSHAFRAAARRSRRVAVNLTNPVTFAGVQVKGVLLGIEEPSSEARTVADDYFATFVRTLVAVGFKAEQLGGFFCSRGGARFLRVEPKQLFNQTPGSGAGAPI